MGSKKEYEEKQRHGTVALPVGLHKMEYPEGTDVIFYLHWHQEFEFLVLTKGQIVFNMNCMKETACLSTQICCIPQRQ